MFAVSRIFNLLRVQRVLELVWTVDNTGMDHLNSPLVSVEYNEALLPWLCITLHK